MNKQVLRGMAILLTFFLLLGAVPTTVAAASKKVGAPKITKAIVDQGGDGVYLEWKEGKNSKKTEVFVSINNASFKKLKTVEDNSYYFDDIAKDASLKFIVRGVNGKKKSAFSSPKAATVKPWDKNDCLNYILKKTKKKAIVDTEKFEGQDEEGNAYSENVETKIERISNKELRFTYTIKDENDSITVKMNLSKSDVKQSKTDITVEYTGVEDDFSATAKINMKKMKGGDDLSFTIKSSENANNSEYSKYCQNMADEALTAWEGTLLDETNITLEQLGFAKLSYFDF